MKARFIIAEYNPLHKGHVEQLKIARHRLQEDEALVILMSGDFCQRGIPAILDKYQRASSAIKLGADLVLKLPSYYSCSHAGNFAKGAISIIAGTNICSEIICGSESANYELLSEFATIINDESPYFKLSLKSELELGLSFADARARALIDTLKETKLDLYLKYGKDYILDFLKQSNDILALAYLSELKKHNMHDKIFFHKRVGKLNEKDSSLMNNEIDETSKAFATISEELLPASALRELLSSNRKPSQIMMNLSSYLPPVITASLCMATKNSKLLFSSDLSLLLHQSLNMMDKEAISKLPEFSEGLLDRILNTYQELNLDNYYDTFEALVDMVASKRYPKTRVRRALLHLILGADNFILDDIDLKYTRILAYNRKGRYLLKEMRKASDICLISNSAAALKSLDNEQLKYFKLDLKAEMLCDILRGNKKNSLFSKYPIEIKIKHK